MDSNIDKKYSKNDIIELIKATEKELWKQGTLGGNKTWKNIILELLSFLS